MKKNSKYEDAESILQKAENCFSKTCMEFSSRSKRLCGALDRPDVLLRSLAFTTEKKIRTNLGFLGEFKKDRNRLIFSFFHNKPVVAKQVYSMLQNYSFVKQIGINVVLQHRTNQIVMTLPVFSEQHRQVLIVQQNALAEQFGCAMRRNRLKFKKQIRNLFSVRLHSHDLKRFNDKLEKKFCAKQQCYFDNCSRLFKRKNARIR